MTLRRLYSRHNRRIIADGLALLASILTLPRTHTSRT